MCQLGHLSQGQEKSLQPNTTKYLEDEYRDGPRRFKRTRSFETTAEIIHSFLKRLIVTNTCMVFYCNNCITYSALELFENFLFRMTRQSTTHDRKNQKSSHRETKKSRSTIPRLIKSLRELFRLASLVD